MTRPLELNLENFTINRTDCAVQSSATKSDLVYFLSEPSGATPFDPGVALPANLTSPSLGEAAQASPTGRSSTPREKLSGPTGVEGVHAAWLFPLRFEAFHEHLRPAGEGTATKSLSAGVSTQVELAADELVMRGIFVPHHKRALLFSQVLNLKLAELPRHRPSIHIDLWRVVSIDE